MEPVRWGVLGVADHFRLRVYVPTRNSDSVTIHGIASRQADKANKAAREFGIPKSYGSYEDLLKDDDIEAVFIPLPNHMHVEWIITPHIADRPLGEGQRGVRLGFRPRNIKSAS